MSLINQIIRAIREGGNIPATQDEIFLSLRQDGIACSSGSVGRRMREHRGMFDTIKHKNYKKWKLKQLQ